MYIDNIIDLVCSQTGCKRNDIIYRKSRVEINVLSRQLCAYFVREYTMLSWHSIAKIMRKSHSTLIYYHKTISDRISVDIKFREYVQSIKKNIDYQNEKNMR